MTTLRIFDIDPESGRLLGVHQLVGTLLRLGLVAMRCNWAVMAGAWGYGTWICELESRLEGRVRLDVSPVELVNTLDQGEYFFDVSIEFASHPPIRAGLADSAFLFVEGPKTLVAAVAAEFTSIEVIDDA